MSSRRRVLLLELNEVTWDLIDPFIHEGKLPTFARLKSEGMWAAPMSVDLPPQMDPWITWTTLYTGRPQADHGVFFLEQPPETIRAGRIWEICHQHGLRVGVYGSLCSWPPQKVNGFYVPDTFAPDPSTYPEELRPIQELNLTYTRSIRLQSDRDDLLFKARLGAKLLKLGLGLGTAGHVVKQLARERLNASTRWRRVALQTRVNFDFFKRLYRRYRPDFASYHTNHVAHYMHTYWKPMQPELFPQATSAKERRNYAGAIEHGYRTADVLLKKMLALRDDNTVLVVASSMGQKPFVSEKRKGKVIVELRSLDRLLEILGVAGRARAVSTMSGQFNINTDSPATKEFVINALKAAYIDRPECPMFSMFSVGNTITANLTVHEFESISPDSRFCFPHAGISVRYEELVHDTGMVKSGCHDPKGVLLLYGPGVRAGVQLPAATNLDIAPTLLTMLGIPVPHEMHGRVLHETLAERSDFHLSRQAVSV
jgi:hypothetical protein